MTPQRIFTSEGWTWDGEPELDYSLPPREFAQQLAARKAARDVVQYGPPLAPKPAWSSGVLMPMTTDTRNRAGDRRFATPTAAHWGDGGVTYPAPHGLARPCACHPPAQGYSYEAALGLDAWPRTGERVVMAQIALVPPERRLMDTLTRIQRQAAQHGRSIYAQGQFAVDPGTQYIDNTTGIVAYVDENGTLVPGVTENPTAVVVNDTGQGFEEVPLDSPAAEIPPLAPNGFSFSPSVPLVVPPIPSAPATWTIVVFDRATNARLGGVAVTVNGVAQQTRGDGAAGPWTFPPGTYPYSAALAGYRAVADQVRFDAGTNTTGGLALDKVTAPVVTTPPVLTLTTPLTTTGGRGGGGSLLPLVALAAAVAGIYVMTREDREESEVYA